ncbi:MAG: LacI family DNA-binding transcriptional regulator [Clostridia bacterium]|nr:LacI family DNA-binding transcriptional regulator [Clostridia bacterium]
MNIYDIAEKCGVSIATVSRVLNNNPNVSAATRARVLAVMEEENYTPSALARGLGTGSMRMVGVLCTTLCNPYYADALAYVEAHLRRRGLHLLLRCTGTDPQENSQALQYMLQNHVEAILLIGAIPPAPEEEPALAAAARQVPVILLDGDLDLPGVYCVCGDHKGAIMELVGQLVRRQRRRILLLHDAMTYSCRQKIDGYTDAYATYGLAVDPQLIVAVDSDLDAVNTCIKRLLVNRVTFDAVIGAEDMLALGAQKALQRTGLSMPIIGFNNSLPARCATPELTSVDGDLEALCDAGIRILEDLLEQRPAPAHTRIPTQLVERATFRNN